MKVQVRSKAWRVKKAIVAHIQRRLAFSLGRFGERIEAAWVKLEDVNGPKGGADKQCVIQLHLRPAGRVQSEALDSDWWTAIDAASERIRRVVARTLDRHRSLRLETPTELRKGAWV